MKDVAIILSQSLPLMLNPATPLTLITLIVVYYTIFGFASTTGMSYQEKGEARFLPKWFEQIRYAFWYAWQWFWLLSARAPKFAVHLRIR